MWRHIRDRWRFTVTAWKKVGIWQCEWLPFSQEKRLKHKMTFLWGEEIVTHNLNNIPCLRVSSWQACLTNFKRTTLAISTIKSSTCIMLCVTHVCSQLDFSHASDNSRDTSWDMQCGVFHHRGVYLPKHKRHRSVTSHDLFVQSRSLANICARLLLASVAPCFYNKHP